MLGLFIEIGKPLEITLKVIPECSPKNQLLFSLWENRLDCIRNARKMREDIRSFFINLNIPISIYYKTQYNTKSYKRYENNFVFCHDVAESE
jgi:hypothetical protein